MRSVQDLRSRPFHQLARYGTSTASYPITPPHLSEVTGLLTCRHICLDGVSSGHTSISVKLPLALRNASSWSKMLNWSAAGCSGFSENLSTGQDQSVWCPVAVCRNTNCQAPLVEEYVVEGGLSGNNCGGGGSSGGGGEGGVSKGEISDSGGGDGRVGGGEGRGGVGGGEVGKSESTGEGGGEGVGGVSGSKGGGGKGSELSGGGKGGDEFGGELSIKQLPSSLLACESKL